MVLLQKALREFVRRLALNQDLSFIVPTPRHVNQNGNVTGRFSVNLVLDKMGIKVCDDDDPINNLDVLKDEIILNDAPFTPVVESEEESAGPIKVKRGRPKKIHPKKDTERAPKRVKLEPQVPSDTEYWNMPCSNHTTNSIDEDMLTASASSTPRSTECPNSFPEPWPEKVDNFYPVLENNVLLNYIEGTPTGLIGPSFLPAHNMPSKDISYFPGHAVFNYSDMSNNNFNAGFSNAGLF